VGNEEGLGVIRQPGDCLLRSAIAVCHKSQTGAASVEKTATISGDNDVEGSLAFNTKNAANFDQRPYGRAPMMGRGIYRKKENEL